MWLAYDLVDAYYSVMPYVYVDSSSRSLSGGLLYLSHEDYSFAGREARGLVAADTESVARGSRRVSKCSSPCVCKIRYLFWLKNLFMSHLFCQ